MSFSRLIPALVSLVLVIAAGVSIWVGPRVAGRYVAEVRAPMQIAAPIPIESAGAYGTAASKMHDLPDSLRRHSESQEHLARSLDHLHSQGLEVALVAGLVFGIIIALLGGKKT